jgi:hypothetical protein
MHNWFGLTVTVRSGRILKWPDTAGANVCEKLLVLYSSFVQYNGISEMNTSMQFFT